MVVDLVQEKNISAIINIHEVKLAELFTKRIVGLREGRIVYDEEAAKLDTDALTLIYGEEDWESERPAEDESEWWQMNSENQAVEERTWSKPKLIDSAFFKMDYYFFSNYLYYFCS